MFRAMSAAAVNDRDVGGRWELAVLGALVVAAAVLRLHYLGEPMRFDEAYTFYAYATQTVGHIVSTYDGPNNHILYSLLVHGSWRVFGDHVWVVRLPAFIAGVAIVPVAYLVGRALYDRRSGLWAAALTAVFAPLVDYSVNGRGYTVGVLLVLVGLWLGVRFLANPRPVMWALVVLAFALSMYAVPTMAYGVATVGVWLVSVLVVRPPPRRIRVVLAVIAAVGVSALLAWLLYPSGFGHRATGLANELSTHRSGIRIVATRVWGNWNRAAPHPLDWIVLIGFLAGLVLHRRIARQTVPIAAAAVVVLGGIVLFAPISPLIRSWLYLLPLYLITAAAGISWAAGRVLARFGPRLVALGSAGAAACVAVGLGIALLATGMRTAEARPASDNDLVALLHRYVHPGEHALLDIHVRVPAIYYVHRFGGGGLTGTAVGPAEIRAGHVVVVVARFAGTPVSPIDLVRTAGGRPGGPARLLVRRPWIDFYDVPLSR